MTKRAHKSLVFWQILLLSLCFSGCGRQTPVEKASQEQILLKGNGADPSSLDPQMATGLPESHIITALLEGLMKPDPETLNPLPGMAERYELSEDRTVYTFHLRPEAQWSNGDSVQAADFVFAYQRMLHPKFGGQYAYMLYCMKNAEAYQQRKIADFSEVGVKAIAPTILQIELNAPTPYFLSLLTHYSWYPVHPATVLKHGALYDRNTRWARPGNYVGNGPFLLDTWKIRDVVIVRRNPDYYDAKSIKLQAVHFYPMDTATEERAFRAGQIHLTSSLPLHKINTYRNRQDPAFSLASGLGTYYYSFNTRRPPLDNPKVREALSLVIDRKSICERILKNTKIPAYAFTPPNTAGYTARMQLSENADRARSLLAEAGYPNGENFPKLELLYNTSESHKIIAEAIQNMWQEELGVSISLLNQEWKVYLNNRNQGNFDIIRAGWIGDYNDPNTFLELLTSNSGNNSSGWANPRYDELIRQAALTADAAERFELFQQAEALLLTELPITPIYFYQYTSLTHPSVQGWYANILDNHPFQGVSIQEEAVR